MVAGFHLLHKCLVTSPVDASLPFNKKGSLCSKEHPKKQKQGLCQPGTPLSAQFWSYLHQTGNNNCQVPDKLFTGLFCIFNMPQHNGRLRTL